MSKFKVPAGNPEEHDCFVGYDAAHDSYFVYVAHYYVRGGRADKNAGHVILWAGIRHNEIDSVEELAVRLNPYAVLSEELFQPLRNVRLRTARPPQFSSLLGMADLKTKT
jgi:hypothetical protein